jgi:ribosomal protein S18 acetylase RimI-like enzyme
MILIREGTEKDAEGLARVHVESWKSTYRGLVPDDYLGSLDPEARARDFRAWFQDPADRFLLAAANLGEQLVGFASGGKERGDHEPGTGELYAIYLLQEYQRQGIGQKLFSACADRLGRMGYKRLVLYCLAENLHQRFYSALGGTQETCVKQVQIGGRDFNQAKFFWTL